MKLLVDADGWRVGAIVSPRDIPTRIAGGSDAVALMVGARRHGGRAKLIAGIRADGGRGADIPILVTGSPVSSGADADGVVDEPFSATVWNDALRPWMPRDEAPALARLASGFGTEAVARLLDGLRGQMRDALAMAAADAAMPLVAHRLAGIAGSLGFAAVSEAWRAVSEGDAAAWPEARIATRRALHAITSGRALCDAAG